LVDALARQLASQPASEAASQPASQLDSQLASMQKALEITKKTKRTKACSPKHQKNVGNNKKKQKNQRFE
jgi:hypothetical protein